MKKKILFLIPFAVSFLSTLTSCGAKADLTIWVDNKIQGVIEDRIKEFKKENSDFKYTVRVDNVSEQTAATNMITDVQGGADIYIFAQDQFSRLITAGALSALPSDKKDFNTTIEEDVGSRNDSGSVEAVTHPDEKGVERLFAYPVTSDNGYFLYYDNELFNEGGTNGKGDISKLQSIIDTCASKQRYFGFSIKDGFWYGAGVFMSYKLVDGEFKGPICHSNWTTDGSGSFISFEDNFKDNGQFALKAMCKLYGSTYSLDSHNASDLGTGNKDAAVICSGVWDYQTAKDKLGSRLGMAKLPTFIVDDKTYQMGSFSGYKLMGVKPHEDKNKAYWCAKLADFLTNEDSQVELFNKAGWGPSNTNAKDSVGDAAQLKALAAQNVYATPQGCYPNDWWKAGEDTICGKLRGKPSVSDQEIKDMLENYQSRIEKLVENN